MENIEGIKSIQNINEQLEQFKTTIDPLIQQNNEYQQNYKRYENKDFTVKQQRGETVDQAIGRIETMMDQIEDVKKRNDLIIQTTTEFLDKIEKTKNNNE